MARADSVLDEKIEGKSSQGLSSPKDLARNLADFAKFNKLDFNKMSMNDVVKQYMNALSKSVSSAAAQKELQNMMAEGFDEAVDVSKIIKELISTGWSGSNDEQGKAVQLLRGLAFSDDPLSNKFMKALDKATSGMNPADFT